MHKEWQSEWIGSWSGWKDRLSKGSVIGKEIGSELKGLQWLPSVLIWNWLLFQVIQKMQRKIPATFEELSVLGFHPWLRSQLRPRFSSFFCVVKRFEYYQFQELFGGHLICLNTFCYHFGKSLQFWDLLPASQSQYQSGIWLPIQFWQVIHRFAGDGLVLLSKPFSLGNAWKTAQSSLYRHHGWTEPTALVS